MVDRGGNGKKRMVYGSVNLLYLCMKHSNNKKKKQHKNYLTVPTPKVYKHLLINKDSPCTSLTTSETC